ncbi:MAG: hypothetical protein R3C09_22150 [Pirellulaceae bacterium]|jgi:hypothetical protein
MARGFVSHDTDGNVSKPNAAGEIIVYYERRMGRIRAGILIPTD